MIPGREAAIAYACVSNAGYVDAYCEQLAALNFTAGLARDAVDEALAANSLPDGQIMRRLLNAVPRPFPAFVTGNDPVGFAAALEVQDEQERRRRLKG